MFRIFHSFASLIQELRPRISYVKHRTPGGAVRFNINAFHTQVRDFQANVVDNAAVIALRSYLANIPEVTVDGVEFDASARLATNLTLRASGLSRSRFRKKIRDYIKSFLTAAEATTKTANSRALISMRLAKTAYYGSANNAGLEFEPLTYS